MTKLMENIDTQLTYGGARKISKYEAELLDQLDESYDTQIKMQRDLDRTKKDKKRVQENMQKTDSAINKYCSETTRDKILLARGWQFRKEEAEEIAKALSDKELLEQRNKDKISIKEVVTNAIANGVTFQDVVATDYVEQIGQLREETKQEEGRN